MDGKTIEFRRFVEYQRPGPESPISLLLNFTDTQETPAALDAPYGRGRVMWFASTADKEWNEFPIYHAFVPLLHEAIPYLLE